MFHTFRGSTLHGTPIRFCAFEEQIEQLAFDSARFVLAPERAESWICDRV
jgi:hypothetical protein